MNRLPAATHIGHVSLTITNLAQSTAYYQRLGLHLQNQTEAEAWLGAGSEMLLHLVENPDAQAYPHTTGLYHFAILVPSRLDLALALKNMVDSKIPIGGYSDHLVSEALYLSDPDGNGIEVYRDRPREKWAYRPNGEMQIDTLPLDLHDLLGELNGRQAVWQGFPEGTILGHIHLHVNDLEAAGRFYTEMIGFDMVATYGRSANFVSAGGYHHHIGMNTWAGVGIPEPPANAIGLRYYSIVLSDETAVKAVQTQLNQKQVRTSPQTNGFAVHDPAGNQIHFTIGN